VTTTSVRIDQSVNGPVA